MSQRLSLDKFSRKECEAAIRGEAIPAALGLRLHQLCVIRGIRYHADFAHELRGVLPEFTRALNARMIMSNSIPEDMDDPNAQPYCVWHPETASEGTYRALVERYPSMKYQVGRACAVAGYANLYKELDILPDVSIAEEARDSGGTAIYDEIVAQNVRWRVMNDYERALSENPRPADLNGDTAVRWSLDVKQGFNDIPDEDDFDNWDLGDALNNDGFEGRMLDITEDLNIDIHTTSAHDVRRLRPSCDMAKLFTEPLPRDLPTVDKDTLICMAAYYGELDRYTRLRRPIPVRREILCCMRGIYHNTMFAVWWSRQDTSQEQYLSQAIEARFIMNNALHRVSSPTFQAPYLIWYPTLAQAWTYRKLAELRPDMLPQIVRSCIVAGYTELFDELVNAIIPDDAVVFEAAASGDAYYREALEKRSREVGTTKLSGSEGWKLATTEVLQRSDATVLKHFDSAGPAGDFDSLYNGAQCEVGEVELWVSLPPEWRIPEEDEDFRKILDYEDWPTEKT